MWVRLNTKNFNTIDKILTKSFQTYGHLKARVINSQGMVEKEIKVKGFSSGEKLGKTYLKVTNSFKPTWEWFDHKSWAYRVLAVYIPNFLYEEEETMKLTDILQIDNLIIELTTEQANILKNTTEGKEVLESGCKNVKCHKALKVGDELLSVSEFKLNVTKVPSEDD